MAEMTVTEAIEELKPVWISHRSGPYTLEVVISGEQAQQIAALLEQQSEQIENLKCCAQCFWYLDDSKECDCEYSEKYRENMSVCLDGDDRCSDWMSKINPICQKKYFKREVANDELLRIAIECQDAGRPIFWGCKNISPTVVIKLYKTIEQQAAEIARLKNERSND